jgi:CheY-like chemotaxis protein
VLTLVLDPERLHELKAMATPKILVIDDDPQIRMLFRQVLEDENMEVVDAGGGREGISIFGSTEFDLVITDLFMPDVDGLTVIRDLKKRHPDIKIIGISGGPPQQQAKLLPIGFEFDTLRILKKPVDLDMLVSVIHSMLKIDK